MLTRRENGAIGTRWKSKETKGGRDMLLPDYNPEGRCKKCGYDLVKTTYRPFRVVEVDFNLAQPVRVLNPPIPERLERSCVRCSYTWSENVIGVREIDVRSEAE
jgi:hypothetical protein